MATLGLVGCNTEQSALAPAGSGAEIAYGLTTVMSWGAVAIFALVLVLTALAILLPPNRRGWIGSRGFVVALGIVFPVVTLTALLAWGLTTHGTLATEGPPQLRIAVEGRMWWWRVRYVDAAGEAVLESANEIHIPVDRPVELVLTTSDVIHSFWVPALAGKLDMIPGRANRMTFTAERPGIYRGQCAEYCGAMHALMAFKVVVHDEAGFRAWFARESSPAAEPVIAEAKRGADLFVEQGCGTCHAVRGTTSAGDYGPDLTHVGSRLTIAAGSFPNNVGTLAGWIASAQHLKPENGMPSFDRLSGPDLRAIARYLEGLE